MDRRNIFELEKLQIYDILNASNTSTYEWIKFMDVVKELLKKKYEKELMTGTKQRIEP